MCELIADWRFSMPHPLFLRYLRVLHGRGSDLCVRVWRSLESFTKINSPRFHRHLGIGRLVIFISLHAHLDLSHFQELEACVAELESQLASASPTTRFGIGQSSRVSNSHSVLGALGSASTNASGASSLIAGSGAHASNAIKSAAPAAAKASASSAPLPSSTINAAAAAAFAVWRASVAAPAPSSSPSLLRKEIAGAASNLLPPPPPPSAYPPQLQSQIQYQVQVQQMQQLQQLQQRMSNSGFQPGLAAVRNALLSGYPCIGLSKKQDKDFLPATRMQNTLTHA